MPDEYRRAAQVLQVYSFRAIKIAIAKKPTINAIIDAHCRNLRASLLGSILTRVDEMAMVARAMVQNGMHPRPRGPMLSRATIVTFSMNFQKPPVESSSSDTAVIAGIIQPWLCALESVPEDDAPNRHHD